MFQIFRAKAIQKQRPSKTRGGFAVSAGLVIAGLALIAIPSGTAMGQTTFAWTNVTEGFWDISTNWNPSGLPGIGDIASFSLSGGTIVLDDFTATTNPQTGQLSVTEGNYTFNNGNGTAQHVLTINSSDFRFAFLVSGSSTQMRLNDLHFNAVNGGGTISGGATLTVDGFGEHGAKLSIRPSSDIFADGGDFHVDGTLNLLGGGEVSNKIAFLNGTATVSGAGSKWTNHLFFVGNGNLNVENGGEVTANFSNTSGDYTVTGAGSNWTSWELEFNGTLNVKDGGTVSVGSESRLGSVTVTGAGSKLNTGSLKSDFGNFNGWTLNINNGGLVSSGLTFIDSVSQVNLNGGRFEFGTTDYTSFKRINAVSGSLAGNLNVSGLNAVSSFTELTGAIDTSGVTLVNSGRLYGDGQLVAGINNLAAGEIRVSSGQFMAFEGVSNTNAGEINNTGGRVEFNLGLTNQAGGFISGRGEFAANDGWTNNGVMAFSGGLADVYGDVANGASGTIAVAGNSTTAFYDDVTMSAGNMNVNISQNGSAVFFGSYNGGSVGTGTVHTFGDLRPGNSPGIVSFGGDRIMGNSASLLIELGGLNPGMFDQMLVSGDLFLDGALDVQLIDGFTLGYGQTFDVSLVNGSLFGQFANYDDGDLIGNFGGVVLFIDYRTGGAGGNGFSSFSAVPEPSMAMLLGFGMVAAGLGRRRRK